MSFDCISMKEFLSSFSLIKACDVVKDGSLRIATPFQYPNGSLIDVFMSPSSDLTGELELSDKGQTSAYLLDLQIKHWTTTRRKNLVSDICKILGVKNDNGVLKVFFPETEITSVSTHLVHLAQACIRVSDIAFTQRFRTQSVFAEDVEEFIAAAQLPYKTGFIVNGRFGKQVEFDFKVQGQKVQSLVQTVSTSSVTAHNISNEVFRKWYDVQHLGDYQRITVYDSSRDVFREDDISRLSEVSQVVAFPDESEKLKDLIAA